MSDVAEKPKSTSVRRQRSICRVHYNLPRLTAEIAKPLAMPASSLGLQAFHLQVAGHQKTENAKYLGLLQCNNGTILKPILKKSQQREVDFYTKLATATEPDLVELRSFVPKYYGCREFTYNGFTQKYLILEDLTQSMLEQCIMDVKIGKRTWDPLATPEKIQQEQSKYALCKQQYGFCIPGYQVYKLATGQVLKYNKEHGKRLHGQMVKDAIRNFLNGAGVPLCRSLVLQLVSALWQLQRWARRPAHLALYCSSLLLVYDAARLRNCCRQDDQGFRSKCRPARAARGARRRSLPALGGAASFSGQVAAAGPVYHKLGQVPLSCMRAARDTFSPPPAVKSSWTDALDRLHLSHSFEHNYEDKLCEIRREYRAALARLADGAPRAEPWGSVKVIDFVHAFFHAGDARPDDNFREGLDSLVDIFEEFLRETDERD